nr:SPIN1-docking protein isoform X3 [Loxodonta africana]
MALKAEGAALDCFEVTLKCEEAEDEAEAAVVAVIPRPEPMLRVAQQEKTPPPRPSLLEAGGDGYEEPRQQMSWEQEFLVGNSPGGSGRALCMVCGAEIRCPSADTARTHILEQHPHTLDLSPSEKSNILEAWSEGVALLQDVQADQPSPPSSDSGRDVDPDPDPDPDPAGMPAEIVVLLDSEDNPSLQALPKRTRPRGLRPLEFPAAPATEPANKKPRGQRWKEPSGEEPVRKKRSRRVTKNDPDPDPPSSPDSPMETFAAPAEVRHFTDGSFPPGFVLQLFSHTQLRASENKDSPKEGNVAEGGLSQLQSPSPAPPPGLRGTLDLQVIRVRMEEPPAVSLLQDWSKHPPGTKGVRAGDTRDWPAVLSESSTPVGGEPEAGSGVHLPRTNVLSGSAGWERKKRKNHNITEVTIKDVFSSSTFNSSWLLSSLPMGTGGELPKGLLYPQELESQNFCGHRSCSWRTDPMAWACGRCLYFCICSAKSCSGWKTWNHPQLLSLTYLKPNPSQSPVGSPFQIDPKFDHFLLLSLLPPGPSHCHCSLELLQNPPSWFVFCSCPVRPFILNLAIGESMALQQLS